MSKRNFLKKKKKMSLILIFLIENLSLERLSLERLSLLYANNCIEYYKFNIKTMLVCMEKLLLKNDFKNDQIEYYNYNYNDPYPYPYPYQSKKIFFIFRGIPFFYKWSPAFLPQNKISCFIFTNKMFYNYDYDFIYISSFNDFKSKPSLTLYSNPLFLRAKKEFINSFFFLGENEPPLFRLNDPELLRIMLY